MKNVNLANKMNILPDLKRIFKIHIKILVGILFFLYFVLNISYSSQLEEILRSRSTSVFEICKKHFEIRIGYDPDFHYPSFSIEDEKITYQLIDVIYNYHLMSSESCQNKVLIDFIGMIEKIFSYIDIKPSSEIFFEVISNYYNYEKENSFLKFMQMRENEKNNNQSKNEEKENEFIKKITQRSHDIKKILEDLSKTAELDMKYTNHNLSLIENICLMIIFGQSFDINTSSHIEAYEKVLKILFMQNGLVYTKISDTSILFEIYLDSLKSYYDFDKIFQTKVHLGLQKIFDKLSKN